MCSTALKDEQMIDSPMLSDEINNDEETGMKRELDDHILDEVDHILDEDEMLRDENAILGKILLVLKYS
jgi:hypothetical protein